MVRNLSDFKWYYSNLDHRRYLAVYVTDESAKKIGERSGLWSMFGYAMCIGIMSLARPDCWIVVKVDQRDNRLMSQRAVDNLSFERNYRLMKKQDYKLTEGQ